jgi:glycosyltransferase involved in cell wall biosynthesis
MTLKDTQDLEDIEKAIWPFNLKIIKTPLKKHAGENRNIACEESSGDLIICLDADDVSHPQRVEIIKYYFDHYDFDILLHSYTYVGKEEYKNKFISMQESYINQVFSLDNIMHKFALNFHEAWNNKSLFDKGCCIHFGNCAINRRVFNEIKWSNIRRGQDVAFFRTVCGKFQKKLIITAPLLLYMNFRSSFGF